MINVRNGVPALALAIAVVLGGSPALAKQRASHPGHDARAQALDPDESAMTPARENALRECSEIANRFVQKDWGVMQDEHMSSCMVEHGQPQ